MPTAQRVGFYLTGTLSRYPSQVHPVLFRIGAFIVPSYGAMAAAGVLIGLLLAQRNARTVGLPAQQIWNLSIFSLFVALAGSRILLIALNWTVVRAHPSWLLALAMIHHPLLAATAVLLAAGVACWCARRYGLRLDATADALAPALALGLAFEQAGALLAGSGFGVESKVPWAVTYTSAFAARWSGAPIGVALQPVQAYCALAHAAIAAVLMFWIPRRRQQGEVAGLWLVFTAINIFVTEFWRDRVGRGALFDGVLDGPQAASLLLFMCGVVILLERKSARIPHVEAAHV